MKKLTNPNFVIFRVLKKKLVLVILAFLVAGLLAIIFKNYSTKSDFLQQEKDSNLSSPEKLSSQKEEKLSAQGEKSGANSANLASNPGNEEIFKSRKNSNLLKPLSTDFLLGERNAPIVFIEYASLSCPHCAAFAKEGFEKLKSEYIDTGKILYIYRDFPLNHPALAASMIANCQAKAETSEKSASERFYSAIKIIFRTQDNWAFDQKFIEKLETIFKLDGMSKENFKACIGDKKLQEQILHHRMEAAKSLMLKSTPTFFVNGDSIDGYVDFKSIRELIEKKLIEKAVK